MQWLPPINPNGFRNTLLDAYVLPWLLMAFQACPLLPMASLGSHELQRVPMLPMASHGFPWLPMEHMEGDGFSWTRVAADGCQWLRMASRCVSCLSRSPSGAPSGTAALCGRDEAPPPSENSQGRRWGALWGKRRLRGLCGERGLQRPQRPRQPVGPTTTQSLGDFPRLQRPQIAGRAMSVHANLLP
jgi:hypothetical protein